MFSPVFEKRKSEPITYCYATDPLGMLWIKLSNIFFFFYFSNIIPLLYIVPKIMGINGVYLANALSNIISGAIALVFLYIDIHRLARDKIAQNIFN